MYSFRSTPALLVPPPSPTFKSHQVPQVIEFDHLQWKAIDPAGIKAPKTRFIMDTDDRQDPKFYFRLFFFLIGRDQAGRERLMQPHQRHLL